MKRSAPLVALVALIAVWGYNWVVMKIATEYAAPLSFAALRLAGGAAILLAVLAFRRRPLVDRSRLGAYFWIGISQSAAFVGLATVAVMLGGAGRISLLAYTMPVWLALLAWPILGDKLTAWHVAALALAASGIALMLGIGHGHASLVADVLAIAAGLGWAIGAILTKRLQKQFTLDILELTTWQMVFGGLALGVVALAVPHSPARWTPSYVAALSYNVVIATALAYVLWVFVLDKMNARNASMGVLGSPVVGVIASWIQFGERPSALEAAGMLLVLGGIAIASLAPQRT